MMRVSNWSVYSWFYTQNILHPIFSNNKKQNWTNTGDGEESLYDQEEYSTRLAFSAPLQDLTVEEGDDVVIKCLTRDVAESVVWMKDGNPVYDNITAYSSGRVHRLQIENVYPSDQGTYTCQLKSGTKTSGKLTVKGKFPSVN